MADCKKTPPDPAVIDKSFFDTLWPVILDENRCDIKAEQTCEYFEPERRFNAVWANDLLARKRFKDYTKPIKIGCDWSSDEDESSSQVQKQQEEAEENTSLRACVKSSSTIELPPCTYGGPKPAPHPCDIKPKDVYWELTTELLEKFEEPFDRDLISAIHAYKCTFMIIDVGGDVPIKEMERWLKYCCFVHMVVGTRCETMARQLRLLNGTFHTHLFQDNFENTWQEELMRALNTGLEQAKRLDIYKDAAQPFPFVFSHKRDMNNFDTFRILRKS